MKQREITRYEAESLFTRYIDCEEISYREPTKKIIIEDAYMFMLVLDSGKSIQVYTSENQIDNFTLKA